MPKRLCEQQENPSSSFLNNEIIEDRQNDYYYITYSLTPTAIQDDWKTPCEFHQCPIEISATPLIDYYMKLRFRAPFCSSKYYSNVVAKAVLSPDKQTIWVITYNPQSIKPWAITEIKMYKDKFLHRNLHQYFSKDGARKYFTIAQGIEWKGSDSIDDYC